MRAVGAIVAIVALASVCVAQTPEPTQVATETTCFPADAKVELMGGELRRMDELEIGDRVRVSPSEYSEVYAFSHRDAKAVSAHISIGVDGDRAVIELTASHLIPVGAKLVAAGDIHLGDKLALADGSFGEVTSIETVVKHGLYNPHTVQGEVVVNGVVLSTYTTAIEPALAKLLLAVPRALYRLGLSDPLLGLLDGKLPKMVYRLIRPLSA